MSAPEIHADILTTYNKKLEKLPESEGAEMISYYEKLMTKKIKKV